MIKRPLSDGVVHKIPTDVKERLLSSEKMYTSWENITPLARNEWLCFIDPAKKEDTRKGRIERLHNDLLQGKKRPCCWAGCTHR
jgi:uncharacterized protein YdeI (YjbR/CyaY-like superfamily)